jgi:hypothetical protein
MDIDRKLFLLKQKLKQKSLERSEPLIDINELRRPNHKDFEKANREEPGVGNNGIFYGEDRLVG